MMDGTQDLAEKHPRWIWGVAANVVDENIFGEERRIRHGTKYFRANQRVWCLPARWDGGRWERFHVIGRRRGKHGLVRVIMSSEQLRNPRVKRIYSPAVIAKIYEADRNDSNLGLLLIGQSESCREDAETFADLIGESSAEQG